MCPNDRYSYWVRTQNLLFNRLRTSPKGQMVWDDAWRRYRKLMNLTCRGLAG